MIKWAESDKLRVITETIICLLETIVANITHNIALYTVGFH